MTPAQIVLIQSTWKQVVPISETAAALFYGRLFEIAPEVKPLFKGDLKEQGFKLMRMLGTVVSGLSNLSDIVPAAEALAKRHVGYGVKPEHYNPVGAALLWTLEKGLGEGYTPEVAAAWTEAYTILSGAMIKAAHPAEG